MAVLLITPLVALLLMGSLASVACAQSSPGASTGGAIKRLAPGTELSLRDRWLSGRVGLFIPWSTPRWLPGLPTAPRSVAITASDRRTWLRSERSRLP